MWVSDDVLILDGHPRLRPLAVARVAVVSAVVHREQGPTQSGHEFRVVELADQVAHLVDKPHAAVAGAPGELFDKRLWTRQVREGRVREHGVDEIPS